MHRLRNAAVGVIVALLAAGSAASCAAEDAKEPRTIDIKVTDQGYEPARVELTAGERVRLAFHSETDSACQGTVQSKDLGIKSTTLPKGKTTVIEIAPKEAGEYSFACAMAMIRGTVIVKGS